MLIVNLLTFTYLTWIIIAPDKRGYPQNIFRISPRKHIVGTHQKGLLEALLMSTHNMCFCGEIRNISVISAEKS